MLKSHERFYSSNGKRMILVADDEMINREMLGNLLSADYDVIFANDGKEAVDKIRQNKDMLSLVLLDLIMPELNGIDVLKLIKNDQLLKHIPVIVITSDQRSEVESLTLGAIDFIPKPYPQPSVILARVLRSIELSEDRMIINSTERDPLTELYNREYFYQYAEQFDHHHKEMAMDAIVIDIFHFHTINERFGTTYGDEVLRLISRRLRDAVGSSGGIVCRREADTFMVYCPHGYDYPKLYESISKGLSGGDALSHRIRLRMGVYENVNKELPIERRFDRAAMAAEKVKSSFSGNIGIYDNTMHEKELYAEQLLEDFQKAIDEKQFTVFYQPKFDIRPNVPTLSSAEALVRWKHPKLGMISPAVFIPLFEDNCLIQQLDNFVWHEAARQIAYWKKELGFTVPISVNVSRIDMYDPKIIEIFREILKTNSLNPSEMLLEITESAYTEDSEQMIEAVSELRRLGFRIEMDDFGTGYSSLNMISTLPLDALKLDMRFIRQAFSKRKDTKLLEIIIDIADYLSVPVIAEGVETEEQLVSLKAIGCDIVQGYYFSKPIPANEFEKFIIERKNQIESERRNRVTFSSIAQALSQDYFCIYYVNTATDHFIEYSANDEYLNLGIEKNGEDFFNLSRKNALRVLHPDDVNMFLSLFTKENIMAELDYCKKFTLTYRIIMNGLPIYAHMKITRMEDKNANHIVIGVSDIDDQMRREQEHLRIMKMASEDALTGVKSKLSYIETEHKINTDIVSGNAKKFAIVVCDINSLKDVNDSLGHRTGDRFIKDACGIICDIFKNSLIFRTGGDEFVIIVKDDDYEIRNELMEIMKARNALAMKGGDVIIACGIAYYRPGKDAAVSAVFERADKAMYENKKELKQTISKEIKC